MACRAGDYPGLPMWPSVIMGAVGRGRSQPRGMLQWKCRSALLGFGEGGGAVSQEHPRVTRNCEEVIVPRSGQWNRPCPASVLAQGCPRRTSALQNRNFRNLFSFRVLNSWDFATANAGNADSELQAPFLTPSRNSLEGYLSHRIIPWTESRPPNPHAEALTPHEMALGGGAFGR